MVTVTPRSLPVCYASDICCPSSRVEVVGARSTQTVLHGVAPSHDPFVAPFGCSASFLDNCRGWVRVPVRVAMALAAGGAAVHRASVRRSSSVVGPLLA